MKRKDMEREIEEMFGFVPEFYGAVPDVIAPAAWELQRDLELSDRTRLDGKTKELIGLAMASHIKCQYCTYFHDRAAALHDADPQEIREAIAMGGLTAFFSNSLTGTRVDFDAFKREVDRAVEHLSAKMR